MPVRNAVCICADARMIIPAFFVAKSVQNNRAEDSKLFDIIIVASPDDVTNEHRDFASAQNIILEESLDVSSTQNLIIRMRRLSSAVFIKLLLARHFQGRYQRIIYLDADLTIHGDVGQLFRLDMGQFALAAVPAGRVWLDRPDSERETAIAHFADLSMTPPYRYFNAGVLLIDSNKWCDEQIDKRAIAFFRKNPTLCDLADEDALNAVVDGRLLELSPIWNMTPDRREFFATSPMILHYTGLRKPWRWFGKHKGLNEHKDAYRLYKKFLQGTPWPNWVASQWSISDFVGSLQFEMTSLNRRILRKNPLVDPVRQLAFMNELRYYCSSTSFADVEQNLVSEPVLISGGASPTANR
jgi:lipopolysaccharide biosynthesis glycosyltransferase